MTTVSDVAPRMTFDTAPVSITTCRDIAGNLVVIEEYKLGVLQKFIARTESGVFEFKSLERAKQVMQIDHSPAPVDDANYESMKLDAIRVMNLIEDILYEAQNNPMRLVAFNSPLLGIALLEVWKHKNPNATQEEWRSVHQQISEFRAVVEANRKRENGI